MRILHLLDIPWHSGLADYALTVARALEPEGHRSWIAAPPGTRAAQAAAASGLPVTPFCTLRSLPALRRFLREEKIDLLNAHTGATHLLSLLATEDAPPQARRPRGQVPAATRRVTVRTRADRRPVRARPGWQLIAARTPRFIGATEAIRRQFIDAYRLPEARARTILPAVELPEAWTPPAWCAGTADRPVLALLGRLDPVKGHHVFLRAAARVRAAVPAAAVVMIGRDEGIRRAELLAEAERFGLAGAVTCTGHLPEIGPALAAATLGVIPSIGSEAVSRAALEWMAHGRAVVASAVGGLPELVEPDRTGRLVPPGDDAALAAAMVDLLSDRARLSVFSRQAREAAETRFAPRRLAAETIRIYEEALRCA